MRGGRSWEKGERFRAWISRSCLVMCFEWACGCCSLLGFWACFVFYFLVSFLLPSWSRMSLSLSLSFSLWFDICSFLGHGSVCLSVSLSVSLLYLIYVVCLWKILFYFTISCVNCGCLDHILRVVFTISLWLVGVKLKEYSLRILPCMFVSNCIELA